MKEYRCGKCKEIVFTFNDKIIEPSGEIERSLLRALYIRLFRIKALGEVIEKSFREKFTGNIQLNFFKGGITNINRNESISVCHDRIDNI